MPTYPKKQRHLFMDGTWTMQIEGAAESSGGWQNRATVERINGLGIWIAQGMNRSSIGVSDLVLVKALSVMT
jgi:hypothetical protein